jgi:hypothetical protein
MQDVITNHVQTWWTSLPNTDRDDLIGFLYTMYHYCANHTNRESHALNDLKRQLKDHYESIISTKNAQLDFMKDQMNIQIEGSLQEVTKRLDQLMTINSTNAISTYDKGKEGEINFDQLIQFQYGNEIEIEDISKSKNCGDRLLTMIDEDIQMIVEVKNHSKSSQAKTRRIQYEVLQQNLQFARQQINQSIHIAICCIMTDVPIGRGKEYLDILKCSFQDSPEGICIIVSGAQKYPHNLYAAIEMAKVFHGMLSLGSTKTDTLINLIRANFGNLQKIQSSMQRWERTLNQLRVDISSCEKEQLNPFIHNLMLHVDISNTKNQERLSVVLNTIKEMMSQGLAITREAVETSCSEKGLPSSTLIRNYGGIRVLKNMALNQLEEKNEKGELLPLTPLPPLD